MKYIISTLFIFIIACSSGSKEANKSLNTNKNEVLEKFIITTFDIIQIINKTFKLDSIKLEEASVFTKSRLYEFTDSSKVVDFKRYLSFIIITYQDQNDSKLEFDKIKHLAKELKNNNQLASKHQEAFRKSGTTYIKADNCIIVHYLRCNMTPDDYRLDKEFVKNMEDITQDIDWVRSYCGWTKMEIKQ